MRIHRIGIAQNNQDGVLIIGCEDCDEPLVTISIDPRDEGPDNDVGQILREHMRQAQKGASQ